MTSTLSPRSDAAFHALLVEVHCGLDDGGINEACSAMYKACRLYADGFGTEEDVAFMKLLDRELKGALGYLSGCARRGEF